MPYLYKGTWTEDFTDYVKEVAQSFGAEDLISDRSQWMRGEVYVYMCGSRKEQAEEGSGLQ